MPTSQKIKLRASIEVEYYPTEGNSNLETEEIIEIDTHLFKEDLEDTLDTIALEAGRKIIVTIQALVPNGL